MDQQKVKLSFRSYLKEDSVADADQLLKKAEEQCPEFFKEFGTDIKNGLFLVRGINGTGDERYIEKIIRSDRMPRDTSNELTNAIDELFKKEFGIKFRTQSAFAFPESIKQGKKLDTIGSYGLPYAIFLKDGYQYCYSVNTKGSFHRDLFVGLSEWFPDQVHNYINTNNVDYHLGMDTFDKVMTTNNTNRGKLLKLAVKLSHTLGIFDRLIKEFYHKGYYTDKNLSKVLNNEALLRNADQHEVMCAGSGYVGIRYDILQTYFKKKA